MSNQSTYDDIEDEISSWGYSLSISDYERSLKAEDDAKSKKSDEMIPQYGVGKASNNYMDTVKLATELSELSIHAAPMGYLPTTSDLIKAPFKNEITPMLRKHGISGDYGELSDRVTNPFVKLEEGLPIDKDVNQLANQNTVVGTSSDEDEPFDPNRPLKDQFKTIEEFALAELASDSQLSEACLRKPQLELATEPTLVDDRIISCLENVTNKKEGLCTKHSNTQCNKLIQASEQKLYTPRQLYEIKKKHAKIDK